MQQRANCSDRVYVDRHPTRLSSTSAHGRPVQQLAIKPTLNCFPDLLYSRSGPMWRQCAWARVPRVSYPTHEPLYLARSIIHLFRHYPEGTV